MRKVSVMKICKKLSFKIYGVMVASCELFFFSLEVVGCDAERDILCFELHLTKK